MANMLATGVNWLNNMLADHAATTIVYRRGGHSVTLPATAGMTSQETMTPDGAMVAVRRHDWTFPAADLVINGQLITPQRGDRITVTRNGVTEVYEVQPDAATGEPSRVDATGLRLRVHTKRIDV